MCSDVEQLFFVNPGSDFVRGSSFVHYWNTISRKREKCEYEISFCKYFLVGKNIVFRNVAHSTRRTRTRYAFWFVCHQMWETASYRRGIRSERGVTLHYPHLLPSFPQNLHLVSFFSCRRYLSISQNPKSNRMWRIIIFYILRHSNVDRSFQFSCLSKNK